MDHRPPALFLADALGLDFLNSLATPIDTPVDWIRDGDSLLDWLEQAHLVPSQALKDLRTRTIPGELDKVAARARDLREWFRVFARAHKGRALTAGDLNELEPLNRLLERDESFSRVVAGDDGPATALQLRKTRRWHAPDSLLLPIAETLATLVCEENFVNVKACEGPACTLMFADHTRGGVRRWCSMALCGNRAKQAAHRSRARLVSSPVSSNDPPRHPTVTRQAPRRS